MPKHRAGSCTIDPLERRLLLDAVPVGPEFRVNTWTTGTQGFPSIAIAADGDFVVTWESFGQDGSSYGIYAQRYNAAGAPKGIEFLVNTYTSDLQRQPTIAMDADGNFVVAWSSLGQDGSGSGIYAQRHNATGVPQGTEFRINTYTTGDQWYPAIAMDADGDFVIAWQSTGQDGSLGGVYAQRYDAAGMPQGTEFRVNTYTPNHQGAPSIAIDANGDFVIAWHSEGQDGSGTGVYAQRYNAAGVPQGAEFRVNTWTTGFQWSSSIATDADGAFVIAWQTFFQDGSGDGIYARRYSASGVAQGGEFQVNTYTTNHQVAPSVAMDAEGNFVMAWHSYDQDGSGTGVYAQRYDSAGVSLGAEFRVNTYTTSSQAVPSIAMDADGDFVIAWQSSGQDGSSYGIYAQRYAVAPAIDASSFNYLDAPHALRFAFTQDVSASLGVEDVLLENLTIGQTIPAGELSLAYDASTNTATFSYTGAASGIAGVLSDGDYRATLLAAGITGPTGAPLAADHIFDFFFLNADANRDARVNLQDFNILAANFGATGRDFTQGNFDYDAAGNVNLADFNILASRFGMTLGPGGTPARGRAQFPQTRSTLFADSTVVVRRSDDQRIAELIEQETACAAAPRSAQWAGATTSRAMETFVPSCLRG